MMMTMMMMMMSTEKYHKNYATVAVLKQTGGKYRDATECPHLTTARCQRQR